MTEQTDVGYYDMMDWKVMNCASNNDGFFALKVMDSVFQLLPIDC